MTPISLLNGVYQRTMYRLKYYFNFIKMGVVLVGLRWAKYCIMDLKTLYSSIVTTRFDTK